MPIPKISEKKYKKLIKLMTKRTFTHKEYIKTAADWWDLYNISVCIGYIRDERLDVKTYGSARHLVRNHFFGDSSNWAMSRGKLQSLTYRSNRLQEAVSDFCFSEVSGARRNWYKETLAYKFGIQSIWRVRDRTGTDVGAVYALSLDGAIQKANMFIIPLLSGIYREDQAKFDVQHSMHSSKESVLEDYIAVATETSGNIAQANSLLENQIKELETQIAANKRVIAAVRDNMMMELEVNGKSS